MRVSRAGDGPVSLPAVVSCSGRGGKRKETGHHADGFDRFHACLTSISRPGSSRNAAWQTSSEIVRMSLSTISASGNWRNKLIYDFFSAKRRIIFTTVAHQTSLVNRPSILLRNVASHIEVTNMHRAKRKVDSTMSVASKGAGSIAWRFSTLTRPWLLWTAGALFWKIAPTDDVGRRGGSLGSTSI